MHEEKTAFLLCYEDVFVYKRFNLLDNDNSFLNINQIMLLKCTLDKCLYFLQLAYFSLVLSTLSLLCIVENVKSTKLTKYLLLFAVVCECYS